MFLLYLINSEIVPLENEPWQVPCTNASEQYYEETSLQTT